MRDVAATALLTAGVAVELLVCAGVLVQREALDRLHYVGAGATATVLIAAAIFVSRSFSLIGNKALLCAALVLVTSPVLTAATARALYERERA